MRAILMYHSMDPSGSAISVAPEAFRAHVGWLASGRVRVVPLEELLDLPEGSEAVAVTFDDGFANFATEAAPLLRDHGLPATLYVVSGHAGGSNAWGGRTSPGIPTLALLDWPALGRLAEAGVALGGHTRTHPPLPSLGKQQKADEIAGCAEDIRRETGVEPRSFAYPYGAHDEPSAAVAAGTYQTACTTDLRALHREERAHLLPRLDMYYFREPGQLEAWGTRAFRWRLQLRARARRLRSAVRPAWKRRP